jgi:hypothetical protein
LRSGIQKARIESEFTGAKNRIAIELVVRRDVLQLGLGVVGIEFVGEDHGYASIDALPRLDRGVG